MRTLRSRTPIRHDPLPSSSGRMPAVSEPAGDLMVPLALRFTEAQVRRLRELRMRTGRRQTELIRNAVDEFLDRQGV